MAAYIGKIEAFDETIEPHGLRMLKANKVDDSSFLILTKYNCNI
jgi:hypothetical protein